MGRGGASAVVGIVSIVTILLGAAAGIQRIREHRYATLVAPDGAPYMTSGSTARRLAVGYSTVAADLYWIRAIQLYGGAKIKLARSESAPLGSQGAPADYQAFARQWDERADSLQAALLRQCGETAMALQLLRDRDEYNERSHAGWRELMAEPDWQDDDLEAD